MPTTSRIHGNSTRPTDNYTFALPYISSASPNGTDPSSGAAIAGFKWWNFTFPTIVDSGTNAIPDFETATNGTVNFGGTAGAYPAWGVSYAKWNDPIQANAWAVPWVVLLPTTVPQGTAATSYSNGVFTMSETGGVTAVPVDLSTTSGSGTLVYQVDRTNGWHRDGQRCRHHDQRRSNDDYQQPHRRDSS